MSDVQNICYKCWQLFTIQQEVTLIDLALSYFFEVEDIFFSLSHLFCYFIFIWRIIALHYGVGFCCISTAQMQIHPHPLEPPSYLLPHPPRAQSTGLRSLSHAANSPLAVCFAYGNVYVSMVLSQFVPPVSFPSYVHKSSLCLRLHCYPANRFVSSIFLDYIYMCCCCCCC